MGRLVYRNWVYERRFHLATTLCIALLVGVVTGSLLVGRSVPASLRARALGELGRTTHLLKENAPFNTADLAARPEILPAYNAEISVRLPNTTREITRVELFATTPGRMQDWAGADWSRITGRGVGVSAALATELACQVGETLLLTLRPPGVRPDAGLFAERVAEPLQLRCRVARIAPAGAACVALRQDRPRSYRIEMDLAWLREQSGLGAEANLLLLATEDPAPLLESIRRTWRLKNLGLTLDTTANATLLKTKTAVFDPALLKTLTAWGRTNGVALEPLGMGLLESLKGSQGAIPYAILATHTEKAGVWIHEWSANQLGVKAGETLELRLLRWSRESGWGTQVDAVRVDRILSMEAAQKLPNPTPPLEGLTDQPAMERWRTPFPLDLSRIRPEDEHYWEAYHTLPKIWVPYGWLEEVEAESTTALLTPDKLPETLAHDLATLRAEPIREIRLAAARGSSDFAMLFLGLGFFLLIGILYLQHLVGQLLINHRRPMLGLLGAVGWGQGLRMRLWLLTLLPVLLLGGVLGAGLGIGYGAILIWLLGGGWSGAVGGTPLELALDPLALGVGGCVGIFGGMITLYSSAREALRRDPLACFYQRETTRGRAGMAGRAELDPVPTSRTLAVISLSVTKRNLPILLTLGGCLMAIAVGARSAEAIGRLLSFLLAGTLLGIAGWLWLNRRLRQGVGRDLLTIPALAWKELAREASRTRVQIALLALAIFMALVCLAQRRSAESFGAEAAGGFALEIRLTQPLQVDPTTRGGRATLGWDEAFYRDVVLIPLYEAEGEDASCRNLAQPTTPRILGIPEVIADAGSFQSAGAHGAGWPAGFWGPEPSSPIPAVLDAASAEWILKKGLGDRLTTATGAELQVAGLFPASIFQGEVLIGEGAFRKLYGERVGIRRLLIKSETLPESEVKRQLEADLANYGAEVTPTREILWRYAEVQNTYLLAFSSLAAFGLLFGGLGLLVLTLQQLAAREGELALLGALGWRRVEILKLLAWEQGWRILLGGALGGGAGGLASLPGWFENGTPLLLWLGLLLILALLTWLGTVGVAWAGLRVTGIEALRKERR